jgi:hypothetical protein
LEHQSLNVYLFASLQPAKTHGANGALTSQATIQIPASFANSDSSTNLTVSVEDELCGPNTSATGVLTTSAQAASQNPLVHVKRGHVEGIKVDFKQKVPASSPSLVPLTPKNQLCAADVEWMASLMHTLSASMEGFNSEDE